MNPDLNSENFDILSRITELRKLRGLSVYKLAKLSGIPQSTIATWYQKNLYPPLDKVERICRVMGISLSDFFRVSEEEGKEEEALLLEHWRRLDEDERSALLLLIRHLKGRESARSAAETAIPGKEE